MLLKPDEIGLVKDGIVAKRKNGNARRGIAFRWGDYPFVVGLASQAPWFYSFRTNNQSVRFQHGGLNQTQANP